MVPRPDPGAASAQRALLWALGAGTFFVGLDARIVAPLLPRIALEFDTSVGNASTVISSYLLPYGLCQLAYGPLADRYGKARIAAYTFLVFSLGTAACGAFASFWALLVMRALTGAAAAAIFPLTIAYIGDTVPYSSRQATLGLLMASAGAAQGLGASVGGLMGQIWSWRTIFPALGGASTVLALWLLRASKNAVKTPRSPSGVGYWQALRSPLGPVLVVVCVEGALFMGAFPFTSGLMESRFGSGPLEIGLVLGVAGVAQIVVAKLLPAMLARAGETRLMQLGGAAMAAAYLLTAFAPSPVWVGVGTALLGGGFCACHSTLQARASEAFVAGRGRALALFAFSLFVGAGAGTLLTAAASEHFGYASSFTVASVAFALFTLLAPRASALPAPSPPGVSTPPPAEVSRANA